MAACGPIPTEPDPQPLEAERQALRPPSSGLTRHLYVLDQQGSCTNWVSGFFQCMLGTTNWNDEANTYPSGETLVWGGLHRVPAGTCGRWDAQCAANSAGWSIQPYDTVLTIIGGVGVGGQNGSATVNGVPVNMGYVGGDQGCDNTTIYGGHEVFEEQTDGVSADCCDAELPAGAPSGCHLVNWCGQCTSACAQYNVTSCHWNGYNGNGSYGISHLACPDGNTYAYQRVSPGNHEFDGTCDAIAVKSSCGYVTVPCTSSSTCCAGLSCQPWVATTTSPVTTVCCMETGQACSNTNDCCGGLACDGTGHCACEALGAFCLRDVDCCGGNACDTPSRKCVARPPPPPDAGRPPPLDAGPGAPDAGTSVPDAGDVQGEGGPDGGNPSPPDGGNGGSRGSAADAGPELPRTAGCHCGQGSALIPWAALALAALSGRMRRERR